MVLVAAGSSADVNAIGVTFTGGNTVAITGVTGTAQLQSMTLSYDANVNASTGVTITYPEIGGVAALAGSQFPIFIPYGATNVIGAITAITITNTAGVMSIAKTGLATNAAGTFRVQF
jgi:expansin (peptidoglycan-binding protein)